MLQRMAERALTADALRGHTDTIILKLLIGGDKYGYQVGNLVFEMSDRLYELNEATMYASLKRLELGQQIVSYWGVETQGGRRKYYKITGLGRETYEQNMKNWQVAKTILDKLL